MIRFAENLNKMITAGLGGALEAPRTEVAVGHRVIYTEVSGAVAKFETNAIAPVKNLRVTMEPVQAGSGDPSPENIRPITGRDVVNVWRESVYDPNAAPALTIQLGQTVYSGTLDVATGVMTIDKVMRTITRFQGAWGAADNGYAVYDTVVDGIRELSIDAISNMFVKSNDSFRIMPAWSFCGGSGASSTITFLLGNGIASKSDADAFAENNPIQYTYQLTTPRVITLDPVTLSTLKGQNNIWSDAGAISLEYPYYEETEGY